MKGKQGPLATNMKQETRETTETKEIRAPLKSPSDLQKGKTQLLHRNPNPQSVHSAWHRHLWPTEDVA